jgi:hypothetical protein
MLHVQQIVGPAPRRHIQIVLRIADDPLHVLEVTHFNHLNLNFSYESGLGHTTSLSALLLAYRCTMNAGSKE